MITLFIIEIQTVSKGLRQKSFCEARKWSKCHEEIMSHYKHFNKSNVCFGFDFRELLYWYITGMHYKPSTNSCVDTYVNLLINTTVKNNITY